MTCSNEKGNFKPMTEINKYIHIYHFEHQNTELQKFTATLQSVSAYCYIPPHTEKFFSLCSSWHSVNLLGKSVKIFANQSQKQELFLTIICITSWPQQKFIKYCDRSSMDSQLGNLWKSKWKYFCCLYICVTNQCSLALNPEYMHSFLAASYQFQYLGTNYQWYYK